MGGTKEIPATYGYMGFVPGDGFYIKMVCEEKDPLRAYENDLDPVYRDSAMEAFFMFESEKERSGLATYLNFEAMPMGRCWLHMEKTGPTGLALPKRN